MWWDTPDTPAARPQAPARPPTMLPRAEDAGPGWPGRFVFIHECVNRCRRRTVLPVGRASWQWDPAGGGTVSPDLHCPSCGTHGFWEKGKWRPA